MRLGSRESQSPVHGRAPPPSSPAIPAISGCRRPRHGAPYLTRNPSPRSIWRNRHRGAAHPPSSPFPANTISTAAASSPASPSSIPFVLSILIPPYTSPNHSLALSFTPGRRRRRPPRAVAGSRLRTTPVTLRLHRLHGRVPITPPVLMLPLIGTQCHPSPAAPFSPHLRPK